MVHNFEAFPELTNTQMQFYYFDSPHKQITQSFEAKVHKVHDGDTISVRCKEREFQFPIRLANTASPELNEEGGREAQQWLEGQILGDLVYIIIDPNNRVEKWGRLLGTVIHKGIDIGSIENMLGFSKPWENRDEGKIKNPVKSPFT